MLGAAVQENQKRLVGKAGGVLVCSVVHFWDGMGVHSLMAAHLPSCTLASGSLTSYLPAVTR